MFDNHLIRYVIQNFEKWSQFRTTDWVNYLEYPEFTLKQTQQLLATLA